MEFDLDSYEPIDYRQWVLGEECRRAVNLRRLNLLNEDELRLVEISSKYQDCRNDAGHGEHAVYSGLKILPYYPEAERKVVVPTAWNHDMGFYGVDPNEWQRLVAEASAGGNLKSLDDEAKRRLHQNRGCLLAGRLFQIASYPPEEYHFEIADILGDHDTRLLPTTVNGRIVRTSDLLWRTSYPHAQIYMANWSPEEILTRVKKTCLEGEKTYLGEIGIQIAGLDFTNMMVHKFGKDVASKVLSSEFPEELERMVAFYQQ